MPLFSILYNDFLKFWKNRDKEFKLEPVHVNFLRNGNYTHFFIRKAFFSTQLQCCLTFSWIQLQMLLSCCLIHISIIILRYVLYLLYLCLCLGLSLFMFYLFDIFFIFSLIFIAINHITSLKQTHLFFVYFLEHLLFLDNNVDEKREQLSNSKSSASGCSLAIA